MEGEVMNAFIYLLWEKVEFHAVCYRKVHLERAEPR